MAEKQNLRKKIYDHEFTNGVSCQHPRVFLRHARFRHSPLAISCAKTINFRPNQVRLAIQLCMKHQKLNPRQLRQRQQNSQLGVRIALSIDQVVVLRMLSKAQ